MGKTLVNFKQQYQLAQQIADLKAKLSELRANQSRSLAFIDIVIDGTGAQGIIVIGSGANAIYLQSRVAGGIDFFRQSDNVKIMSLDKNGNIRALGNITANVAP